MKKKIICGALALSLMLPGVLALGGCKKDPVHTHVYSACDQYVVYGERAYHRTGSCGCGSHLDKELQN